jgi:hypothetical protein
VRKPGTAGAAHFEDLHWIDTEPQALLESLVEGLPTARLLRLVTYRADRQHGWLPRLDALVDVLTNY